MPSAKGRLLFSTGAHHHNIKDDYEIGKTLGTFVSVIFMWHVTHNVAEHFLPSKKDYQRRQEN